MKISKLLPLSVMLTAALTLTACSDSNNTDEGLLTDPFDNTESTTAITADSQDPDITSDNPVRDHMELLSQGGYRCEVIEDRL
ncbi:MAG: hypothetical protein K2J79_06720, partial [Ruminiclostridium sp.]|nr:hypothetical protein [Ruminiclostridium sp.]